MIGTLLFRKKGWRAPSDSGELWVVEPFAQQMHGRPVVIGHPWVGLPKFDILIYIYYIYVFPMLNQKYCLDFEHLFFK